MASFEHIGRKHVLRALKQIDNLNEEALKNSTGYDLLFDGKRYPPKEVLRYASKIANGTELGSFSGGSKTNDYLIKIRFNIVLKGTNQSIGLGYSKNQELHLNDNQFHTTLLISEEFIEDINKQGIIETERDTIVKSRIGQSLFKRRLIEIECKCKLCGVNDERFLIASHIKPWSISNNEERLDVNNGFLLCPNHDALFDKGYISFDDDGRILISNLLDDNSKLFLNITEHFHILINEQQKTYLQWHSENILIESIS